MFDAASAGYVLLLGMVAAFNPCGFALLPAYLTVIMTRSASAQESASASLWRAVSFAGALTVGFLVVFGFFGVLFGAVNLALQGSILPVMPYVTVLLGLGLVGWGAYVARTGQMRGLGVSVTTTAPTTRWLSQVTYGIGFGLASLTCTIGLFLVVVTQSLNATNVPSAVLPFVVYALGMSAVMMGLALIAGLVGTGVLARARRHTRTITRAGGVLMVAAGLYVGLFGLGEVLPRYGVRTLDPVVTSTLKAQSSVLTWMSQWSDAVLAATVATVVVIVAAVWWRQRTRPAAITTPNASASAPQVPVADSATIASLKRAASARAQPTAPLDRPDQPHS